MKKIRLFDRAACLLFLLLITACTPNGGQQAKQIHTKMADCDKGSYGYDVSFFMDRNINVVELRSADSQACVLLIPAYQGRVMTSSADGYQGLSFGWIHYNYIQSGNVSRQFNPYGGEERLWLGPEGGPYSIYFPKGKEQVFANWVVPKELDTDSFEVVSRDARSVVFRKEMTLTNYAGNVLKTGIERKVKLLTVKETEEALNMVLDTSLKFVAYESENKLINKGQTGWSMQTGVLSLWLLSMFNPSPEGVVFVPFKKGSEKELGKIVTDDYFGKVPADRLVVKDGILFFRTDGKFRSKIGISPQRSLPYLGSYDPQHHVLTLLLYSRPEVLSEYVNSKWGKQKNPLEGDVVNAYNDGPVEDGSVMGPFYEMESSSPAAMLSAGGEIVHTQRIFHIIGSEDKLTLITEKLFNLSIAEIKQVF